MNVSKVSKQGMNRTQTGTPYYASPEVWRDEPYSFKSDIWSLGVVIYEMTSLVPPFQAKDMQDLYKKVQKGNIKRIPSHYSNDLWSVIQAMLQDSPANRPSCDQLCESNLFVYYAEKLSELKIVENDFMKQVEQNRSPRYTHPDQLLRTIQIPHDLKQLSLPRRNYIS